MPVFNSFYQLIQLVFLDSVLVLSSPHESLASAGGEQMTLALLSIPNCKSLQLCHAQGLNSQTWGLLIPDISPIELIIVVGFKVIVGADLQGFIETGGNTYKSYFVHL